MCTCVCFSSVSAVQPVSFRKVEELENFGIAKTDIGKLKASGFHTVEAVSVFLMCYIPSFPIVPRLLMRL